MEDIRMTLLTMGNAPWADFLLNPRRLRGSDFLMRWSQGVWSEERLTQAVNATGKYFALPYGPSGTAPDKDVRAFELYFERLEKAGLGNIKRPDLLIYRVQDKAKVDSAVKGLNGLTELPFTTEDEAFGISLADAERLFSRGDIEPTEQVFQAPGGATTNKVIYKIYYRHAYPLATTIVEPQLVADSITDKNGHILPYVRFVGGKSRLSAEALSVLDSLK